MKTTNSIIQLAPADIARLLNQYRPSEVDSLEASVGKNEVLLTAKKKVLIGTASGSVKLIPKEGDQVAIQGDDLIGKLVATGIKTKLNACDDTVSLGKLRVSKSDEPEKKLDDFVTIHKVETCPERGLILHASVAMA